nr:hypothetical protein [Tanacetum cinerariifolium]
RACWLLGIDGEGRGSGVEVPGVSEGLTRRSGEGSGSVMEVVEWTGNQERGVEWGWRENRLLGEQYLLV